MNYNLKDDTMKNSKIMKITFVGLMAALVFAASYMRIVIPLSLGGNTAAIHFGNIFCVISGLLLGPLYGGLAAGIGSALYDLTNPLYISSMPFTLVFKFMLAFVCGLIAYSKDRKAENFKVNVIAAAAGSLAYIILYLGRDFLNNIFFLQLQMMPTLVMTGQKAFASTVNAVLAVVIATPVFFVLKKALDNNNIKI